MSEMVERVAKAMWDSSHDGTWPQDADPSQLVIYRSDAVTAIEAMREPTGAMADAAFEIENARYAVHRPQEDACAVDCWRVMIDTALC